MVAEANNRGREVIKKDNEKFVLEIDKRTFTKLSNNIYDWEQQPYRITMRCNY